MRCAGQSGGQVKRPSSVSKRTGGWLRSTGLAAIALALVGASLSWGTLCLGQDGHLAIEPRAAGQCFSGGAPTTPSPLDALTTLRAEVSLPCCGPCTDLTDPMRQWAMRDGPTKLDPAAALATTPCTDPIGPQWIGTPTGLKAADAVERRPASSVLRC